MLGFWAERRHGTGEITGGGGEKPVAQSGNIFFPLTQRGQPQTNSADSIIKVFAELAGLDFGLQLARGSANEARHAARSVAIAIAMQSDLAN